MVRCKGRFDSTVAPTVSKTREDKQQNTEQIEELEEYVKIQEAYFEVQLTEKETRLTQLNKKYAREKEEWASAKWDFELRYANLASISEQRWLDLLVTQARMMQAEGKTNDQINDLQKALA